MTDWTKRVQDAIDHFQARPRTFSEERSLGLIDFFAEKGTATEAEMQAHGSADFVLTILGHVTTAVHGGGQVPREGGWYRHRKGQPYIIDPDFALAWMSARAASKRSSGA